MKRSRKVRTGKAASTKPRISRRKPKAREAPKEPKEPKEPKDGARDAKELKKKPNPRLAAMAAASAELAEIPDPVKTKAPPAGGVEWNELEMEEPAAPPRKGTVVELPDEAADEVQVVAKTASKFSMQDLEVLKAAIKVKGAGVVLDGINLDELKYDGEGLVPIVAQDRRTGAVLQLGWGNRATIEDSLRSKQMSYWSREHGKVLAKGEGSGHSQRLVRMRVDCDKDSLLALVDQDGPACHLDKGTCWHDGKSAPVATFLGELDRQVQEESKAPKEGTDLAKLLAEPLGALKAFVEDANSVTRALQGKAGAKAVEHAAADTLFHLMVACRAKGVGIDKVVTELFARKIAEELKT